MARPRSILLGTLLLVPACATGGAASSGGADDASMTSPTAPRPSAYERSYDDGSPSAAGARDETPRPPDTIFRDELMRATANGSAPYLLRALTPEVYRPNGRFIGWRIGSLWPEDPSLCAGPCDLREGDIILTVNGRPVERPEQLSELMDALDSMETLEIQMLRDGELRARTYQIAARDGQ